MITLEGLNSDEDVPLTVGVVRSEDGKGIFFGIAGPDTGENTGASFGGGRGGFRSEVSWLVTILGKGGGGGGDHVFLEGTSG